MKFLKLKKPWFLALSFGSFIWGTPSAIEPSNLLDKPEYDTSMTCSPCEKLQYEGLEPNDSFFSKDRRPAILENGVHYEDEEELYIGGKSPFVPTHEAIMEDEVAVEKVK